MSTRGAIKPKICIIAAISRKDRALGKSGGLLWHIPEDLRRFKKLTLGHPVIMGRKTFDSVVSYLGKPLPDRTNIVVTRQNLCIDGALVFNSLEKAIEAAEMIESEEVHIGGGAEIYAQALQYADRLYLTIVNDEPEADTFFPDYSEFTKIIEKEKRDHDGLSFEFVTLERTRF